MDPSAARLPDDDLPFPPEAFDPVPAPVVRLGDPGELAAALPHLVGFAPRNSLVLVGLGGPGGSRVGLTARVDVPPPRHAAALARALAARLDVDGPDAAVLVIASDEADVPVLADGGGSSRTDLPHRDLVHQVVLALEPYGIGLRESLLVRSGRWFSYECPHACCRPGAGTPVPGGTSALAAASVAAGQVVAGSRDELVARLAPAEGAAADRMAGVVVDVGEELAGLVAREGRDAAAQRYDAWVDAAVRSCVAGRARPADDDVARVVWGLRDVRVRDRALGLALGPTAAAAESLWTECARRAPVPLDAAPATLLAVCAWLRGDGTTARIALDRALDSEPGYVLAGLLARGLDAGLTPADLRVMVEGTQADLAALTASRAAPTAAPGRARRERPAPSRTRPRRSPG